jgi:hypothetical protein
MAFAWVKNASNVFPVVGALIELREKPKTGLSVSTAFQSESATWKKATYPTNPEPQCLAILQKNQMAVMIAWVSNNQRETNMFLLTLLIVCDRDGELFPGLQTRVESGRVRAIRSQRRAGVPERTLRDGVHDRRSVIMTRMSICERKVMLSGTTYKKKNVTVVPLLAVKLLGLYTS